MAHRVTYDGSNMKNRDIKNQNSNENNRAEENAEGRMKSAECAKGETAERKAEKARRLSEKEWMRMAVAKAAAEDWWQKISPGRRVLAMTLAGMMDELLVEGHRAERKRIEIRLEAGAIRARFIHLLKQPEAGCLSAIMLPELPSGRSWS